MIRRGLTLIEIMIVISMFVVLIAVSVYFLRAILLTWSSQETRTGIEAMLNRGMEETVRDLREARTVQSSNDEIRFTTDLINYYIYYLYNADDSYPPAFDQSLYELRKAALAGGISGTFTYGSGDIKAIDILPPPTSDLSFTSSLATLDLSVKRGDETIRVKTQIRPRNL